ncbi:NADPH:adrenodoxin oxidoreductase, mitochondrial [Hondaea fermentalgiana]|uniref:NADPH:adrenodoxin oxidoreductase, mitochondrial n=1 Tax=Hondaea fermentalgiana TaxID=2315210 RepID=A0A2R5GVA7_9STRA|nr:NADPH:adrenodoxin oxidoreductase, mitochondrial [Hondaea fermentalgiana]|eukprot:GBG34777.1 NADPH:adrenodoxin oxidoreductase, mitochondrial [Hondaea fermentalgiana]
MALRFCVVGSGPGGMYTAKYLLKALGDRLSVDVVDKLPTAYGLVRYGVAPDHPEVKSVSNDFDEVMADERVRFFGNVHVGKDVSVDDLREAYDGVIFAYGATSDKPLGVKNEEGTKNVWGARAFVNWYNGHPEMADVAPPMLDHESAVIIGQGNVALDCARVLTKSVDELAKTDISRAALELLAESKVRRVSVIGRRGTAQAAFTIKELREQTKLDGVGCVIDKDELARGLTAASLEEIAGARATKRINDLIQKIAADSEKAKKKERNTFLRFLLSPTEILRDDTDRVSGIVLQHNRLEGEANAQRAVPLEGADLETLDCGLLIRSIGYRSEPIPGVPFNDRKATVDNDHGRVEGVKGLYTAGWVKRGPSGIIGTNITCAKDTVDSIVQDVESGAVTGTGQRTGIEPLLKSESPIVSWSDYERLDALERQRGESANPPAVREKLLSVSSMLEAMGLPVKQSQ